VFAATDESSARNSEQWRQGVLQCVLQCLVVVCVCSHIWVTRVDTLRTLNNDAKFCYSVRCSVSCRVGCRVCRSLCCIVSWSVRCRCVSMCARSLCQWRPQHAPTLAHSYNPQTHTSMHKHMFCCVQTSMGLTPQYCPMRLHARTLTRTHKHQHTHAGVLPFVHKVNATDAAVLPDETARTCTNAHTH